MIRCISLHEPWATLVTLGEKKIETRGWSTDYRGRLAIHAAKTTKHLDEMHNAPFFVALTCHGITRPSQLPFGTLLCIVELDWIQPTEIIRGKLSEKELAFGDYSDGRFAWGLRLTRVFDQPIPMKGHQRFWNWDEKI